MSSYIVWKCALPRTSAYGISITCDGLEPPHYILAPFLSFGKPFQELRVLELDGVFFLSHGSGFAAPNLRSMKLSMLP